MILIRRSEVIRDSRGKPRLFRSFCLLVIFVASLFQIQTSEASPRSLSKADYGIFSIPLEEILKINVVSERWDGQWQDGNFAIDLTSTQDLKTKIAALESFSGLTRNKGLLVIDGFEVGALNNLEDISKYAKYFGTRLLRVELYIGDSTRWWGTGKNHRNISIVINLVTKPIDSDESTSQQEEGQAI